MRKAKEAARAADIEEALLAAQLASAELDSQAASAHASAAHSTTQRAGAAASGVGDIKAVLDALQRSPLMLELPDDHPGLRDVAHLVRVDWGLSEV